MSLTLLAALLLAVAPPGGRISVGSRVAKYQAPPYLQFLPTSGFGVPVAENLCDALAAEVPNWSTPIGGSGNWCIRGDRQAVPGSSATFTYVNTTQVNKTICPSGLDCTNAEATQLIPSAVANAYITAPATLVSDQLTACWLGIPASTRWVLIRFENGGGDVISLEFDTSAGGTPTTSLWHTDGTRSFVSLAATDPWARNLTCATWKKGVGLSAYVNNTVGTYVTYKDKDLRQSTALPWCMGGRYGNCSGSSLNADSIHEGAFYIDRELTPTQIAAIAGRVLADKPKAVIDGTPSLPATYTRTGARFCSSSNGTGTILQNDRLCIARGGLLVEAAATNKVVRTQEFDNASWTKEGSGGASAPTVTQNAGTSPDGTLTAERVQFGTCVANPSSSALTQGTSAGTHIASIYLKGYSGASGTVSLCGYTGGDCTQCAFTGSAWTRCERPVSTATTFVVGCVNNTAVYPASLNTGAADVLLWGAQFETGSAAVTLATSYIPATSAAASHGEDILSFAPGSQFRTDAPHSLALTVVPTSFSTVGSNGAGYIEGLAVYPGSYGPRISYSFQTNGFAHQMYSGANLIFSVLYNSPLVAGSEFRVASAYVPSQYADLFRNGSLVGRYTTFGAFTPGPWTTLRFGPGTSLLSNLCLDPNPLRCR